MKKTIILIISILTFISCNNKQDKTQLSSADTTTNSDSKVSKATNEIDTISATYSDTQYLADILRVGDFHGDEVEDNSENKKWFGIFETKKETYLAETKIKTSRFFDEIVDEDSLRGKSGWKVKTINKDNCILLVSGLAFLANRKIPKVKLANDTVFPGDTLNFKYLAQDYKIFATGHKTKDKSDPSSFLVTNYKLFISTVKNGVALTDQLVNEKEFDGEMINIIFAGDIDGDGILDLIIDISNDYNVESPALFLSKPADTGKILKIVGRHTSIGC